MIDTVADMLFGLPGVEAVSLGGSRAHGAHGADSDWDVAVYYRHGFDPQAVREIGWPGHLSEIGGWGRAFNGGGKVGVEDQLVDIHYRDLGFIDGVHEECLRGHFGIEPLLFHQAGIPTYILLAELGTHQTLRGLLPAWGYPTALRRAAPPIWWDRAHLTLEYADGHARHGRAAQCAGLLSEAACYAAHAILAHRGEWVTNEKRLLAKAGLDELDDVIAVLQADPRSCELAVHDTRRLLARSARGAGLDPP